MEDLSTSPILSCLIPYLNLQSIVNLMKTSKSVRIGFTTSEESLKGILERAFPSLKLTKLTNYRAFYDSLSGNFGKPREFTDFTFQLVNKKGNSIVSRLKFDGHKFIGKRCQEGIDNNPKQFKLQICDSNFTVLKEVDQILDRELEDQDVPKLKKGVLRFSDQIRMVVPENSTFLVKRQPTPDKQDFVFTAWFYQRDEPSEEYLDCTPDLIHQTFYDPKCYLESKYYKVLVDIYNERGVPICSTILSPNEENLYFQSPRRDIEEEEEQGRRKISLFLLRADGAITPFPHPKEDFRIGSWESKNFFSWEIDRYNFSYITNFGKRTPNVYKLGRSMRQLKRMKCVQLI